MQSYDLIVCGAGPAGAMAAATAARKGLKVALLEKCPLPRHKTCGGGTPMVMQDFLYNLVPEAFVESDVLYMRHTWNFADPFLGAINPSETDRRFSLWMVQRSLFDHALVHQAWQAGSQVFDGVAVRSVEVDADQVRVNAQIVKSNGGLSKGSEFTATARYLIGADGANGLTAKAANLRQHRTIALGMEVEFPHQWGTGHPDLRPDVLHLEYGAVQRGYAWVFPKADHLNVGAGIFSLRQGDIRSSHQAREALQKAIFTYLETLQLQYDPTRMKFHAHPLPTWCGREPLHTGDGRILLVGDAAGLINPLFGDGILPAVKSGTIAATCVAEGTTSTYSDRIHAEFASSFDAARRLANLFYQYPHFFYRYGVKYEKSTRLATRLIAGDIQFNNILGRTLLKVGKSMVQDLLPPWMGFVYR
ncbi:geranylgeranyl reductase family protein [Kovacikia minuta CCNUW1]|uniref:geranylgeranyl reductase family protein n=1 Tax=Kovacikia minuta TaxID=2931930 RepID=UPI001CCEFEA1|nr:geranylgeranyl reductase family protein [Kovacikia minuta]UBF26451.1 geranylgeranyl reductase family protein [Kovacikia minuta CCNUW1]